MRASKFILLSLFSCFTSFSSAADKAPEGFTDLIAEGGLENFRTYNKDKANAQWKVADGVLSVEGKGGGDLITRKEYEDFDMHLEWKIPAGRNSGIFIGAQESPRAIYQDAIEMQVLGNTGYPGLDDYHIAGSIYALSPSKREWAKPEGEWNKVRIVKKGSLIEFFFNGHSVGKHDLSSKEFAEAVAKTKFNQWPQFGKHNKGHIGFQDHGDSSGLSIRNLYIKEL